MPPAQGSFAAITPIAAVRFGELEALLADVGVAADIASGAPTGAAPPPRGRTPRFAEMSTVHYARWVILPATNEVAGRPIPPQLYLSTNYDAPLRPHLEEFVRLSWPVIDEIYRCCEGYAGGDPTALVEYLKSNSAPPTATYVGCHERDIATIRREETLRKRIETYLDSRDWAGCSAVETRMAIQAEVLGDADLRWALTPAESASFGTRLSRNLRLAGILGAVLAVWPAFPIALAAALRKPLRLRGAMPAVLAGLFLGAPLLAWVWRLRQHERRDPQTASLLPNEEHIRSLERAEDWGQQNQFTKLVLVKPGPFRRYTLLATLFITEVGCRFIFTKGTLTGIRTIHFASWTAIDDRRRLLFLSNFDGSWENYLGEFIDGAGRGLTAIYSNTRLFPVSRWLFWGGTQDERRYKALVRDFQIPSQVWFRAYDQLTVVNINNNSEIRRGLWGTMNEQEAAAWLSRF